MNLKAKAHLENQKKAVEERLAARVAFLKEKKLDETAVGKDPVIRKIKADIRKIRYRLSCIAAQEKLNADKALAKEKKLAAKKEPKEKPEKKAAKEEAAKPAKKEKKEKK